MTSILRHSNIIKLPILVNKLQPHGLTTTRTFFKIGRSSTLVRIKKNFKPFPPAGPIKDITYHDNILRSDDFNHLEKSNFESLQYRKYEFNYTARIEKMNPELKTELTNHLEYFSHEGIRFPASKATNNKPINFTEAKLNYEYVNNGYKIYRRYIGDNQLLLNTTSREWKQFSLKKIETCQNHKLIAFLMLEPSESSGKLWIKDFRKVPDGKEPEPILVDSQAFNFFWSESGDQLFYTVLDSKLRPHQLKTFNLESYSSSIIIEEKDDQSFLDINVSRDKKYILINSNRLTQSKIQVIPSSYNSQTDQPILLQPLTEGVECFVDHFENQFFILSNESGNFKLYTLEDKQAFNNIKSDTKFKSKIELDILSDDHIIQDVEIYKKFIVLYTKVKGDSRIMYYNVATKQVKRISLPHPICSVSPVDNPDYDTAEIQFNYSTLITPRCQLKFDLETSRFTNSNIPYINGVRHNDYVMTRRFTKNGVPITLIHRANLTIAEKKHPCLIVVYGAYGVSLECDYRPEWMVLLNKGFVIALAHVRGGGELGPQWYEAGRGLNRDQSINDLIEVGENLVDSGITSNRKMTGFTWSAGGVILGAAVNRKPDLFHSCVYRVPFLDPVTSLMDEEQALTSVEKEEWGDVANDPKALNHLLTYAPYDNLPAIIDKSKPFPNTLIVTAENDQIVPYWHSLKFIARIRAALSREHASYHFLMTVPERGHTDYLKDAETRKQVLVKELVFIMRSLSAQKPNYL